VLFAIAGAALLVLCGVIAYIAWPTHDPGGTEEDPKQKGPTVGRKQPDVPPGKQPKAAPPTYQPGASIEAVEPDQKLESLALAFGDAGGQVLAGTVVDRNRARFHAWSWDNRAPIELMVKGSLGEWVCLSEDGRLALAGRGFQILRVRSVSSGEIMGRISTGPHVFAAAFSPDSRYLVYGRQKILGDDHRVLVWDLEVGKEVGDGRAFVEPLRCIAVSSGARWAATSDKKGLAVWEVKTGEVRYSESDSILCAAFASKGSFLIAGDASGTIRVVDLPAGKARRFTDRHSDAVTCLALSADGRRLVSGSKDQSVRVWEVSTGKMVQRLDGHEHPLFSVAINADGRRLISGDSAGTIRLWEEKQVRTKER
jgi:WD40 repeat protein